MLSILVALKYNKGLYAVINLTYPVIVTLAVLSLLFTPQIEAQEQRPITKKQVSDYLQRSKDKTILYLCESGTASHCSVVCSSGGNDYIKAEGVTQAFYGERRSSVNGAITGYYLVIDVDETKGEQDIWATLQVESSCLFKGLMPSLGYSRA